MKTIVILGGGTAGWMTANALHRALAIHGYSVTLVESPEIGTIGVGEGSTPHLKRFFDNLQISEKEWMPRCHATYKNGISFVDWTEDLAENRYFHPFPSIIDRQTAGAFLSNCMAKHAGKDVNVNPEHYFLAHTLTQEGRGPKTRQPLAPVAMNYAYHFDSNMLGKFLLDKGLEAGITHVQGKFVAAVSHQHGPKQGDLSHITLADNRAIKADFFIDASGFSSHLLQQHMQVDFISFASNLFNDSAIALPSNTSTQLLAQTKASALSCGWAWHIPLTHRTGNGYVFSRQYISFEDAEIELRKHLSDTNNDANDIPAKRIHMKVGRAKEAWTHNVMAIGLAQGFIEPLEATALHLVMDSIELFIKHFDGGNYKAGDQQRFNQSVAERYEGIRDYIVCHYKVNRKNNSQYWIDCRNIDNLSDNLQAVLEAWRTKQDISPILERNNMLTYYPAISWYCLLAGYGHYDHVIGSSPPANLQHFGIAKADFDRMRTFIRERSAQFERHQTLLTSLSRH